MICANELTRRNRTLTTEIWYPAAEGTQAGCNYAALLRYGETTIDLHGQAARDAEPRTDGTFRAAPPARLLERYVAGSESRAALPDDRVKAIVTFGPWGRNRNFRGAQTMAAFDNPLMMLAGDAEDISGHDALRKIFNEAVGTSRDSRVFEGANHKASAPIPIPTGHSGHFVLFRPMLVAPLFGQNRRSESLLHTLAGCAISLIPSRGRTGQSNGPKRAPPLSPE